MGGQLSQPFQDDVWFTGFPDAVSLGEGLPFPQGPAQETQLPGTLGGNGVL